MIRINNTLSNKRLWAYPLIFGIFPVIALIAVNSDQMSPMEGLRALLVSFIFSATVYGVLRLTTRNWGKAAVLTVFWLALFFSYGHVYEALEGKDLMGVIIGRHAILALIYLSLGVVGSIVVVKSVNVSNNIHLLLTIFCTFLVVVPLVQGLWVWGRMNLPSQQKAVASPLVTGSEKLPDIYYIILDSYTREDTLNEEFGFDNSHFIQQLEELGFSVSDCSYSNYGWTPLALSSTFMMDYILNLDDLSKIEDKDQDYPQYQEYIVHSNVRKLLNERGYKTVAFATGYAFTAMTDADVYIESNSNPLDAFKPGYGTNAFEELYLRTTAVRIAMESFDAWFKQLIPDDRSSYRKHYDWVLFQLDQLSVVPSIPGPKFVFVHISAPHPPFVFASDGEFRYTNQSDVGYPEEIQYLNKRMLPILTKIIADSEQPPIIVVQGDHGLRKDRRTEILYATYFPGVQGDLPYKTPVNTFRWVLSKYFGQDLPLLEDHSYQFTTDEMQALIEVPLTCPEQ